MHAAEVPWADRSYWPRIMEIEQRSFYQPWRIEDFQLLAHDERALNVGLWHGDDLAGYALGYVDEARAEVHLASLAVDPDYRLRGWGSFLLSEILIRARRRHCLVCCLEVRVSNVGAQKLYQRFQFEVSGRHSGFYTDPVEDAVLMHRSLKELSIQPGSVPSKQGAALVG